MGASTLRPTLLLLLLFAGCIHGNNRPPVLSGSFIATGRIDTGKIIIAAHPPYKFAYHIFTSALNTSYVANVSPHSKEGLIYRTHSSFNGTSGGDRWCCGFRVYGAVMSKESRFSTHNDQYIHWAATSTQPASSGTCLGEKVHWFKGYPALHMPTDLFVNETTGSITTEIAFDTTYHSPICIKLNGGKPRYFAFQPTVPSPVYFRTPNVCDNQAVRDACPEGVHYAN
eukprot:TRINITY_DN65948_c10_g1_i1.p1 TRINITY_DN65948_c10_g1~~TRINITY_DN65948_c10_g1_i1.p1  ORF type:complete len:234 (-),score=6.34 TRINITY_DN65948_c10_g1_i1:141-821(-)